MASPLLEHMGDYYGGGNFVGYLGAVGLCLTGTRIPCRVGVPCVSPAHPLRIPCASPAQCSGVRTGVGARHGEPVGDHSDGGNFVGYHNTAGLRVGRGQPVRVTNRYVDHAGARGRKVGVPFRTLPQGGCPLPQGGCPLPQGGCPLITISPDCGLAVGSPCV